MREHFLDNLARDWPEMLPHYERLYAGRAYLPDALVKPVRDRARDLARQFEISDRRLVRSARLAATPEYEQLSLILAADALDRAA